MLSRPVWMTNAGMDGWTDQDVWYRAIAGQCESPAEEAMAALLVNHAIGFLVDGDPRDFVCVHPQFDLSESYNLPYRVDFMLITRQQGAVVVEVDGFAWHSDQEAFKKDRCRDRKFSAAGIRVMRFTAAECLNPDDDVHGEISSLLCRESPL